MSYSDVVQKAYIAYYGRPADPGGLAYWVGRLEESGGNLNEIINLFANSPESQGLFGSLDPGAQINQLYMQLFGRAPDDGGREFYAGLLEDNAAEPGFLGKIALLILDGAQNDDAVLIARKLQVANAFTDALEANPDANGGYVGDGPAASARELLAVVPLAGTLNNLLFGTDGPDVLVGTEGPDFISAGRGDDRLAGGQGDDILIGGDGIDRIRYFYDTDFPGDKLTGTNDFHYFEEGVMPSGGDPGTLDRLQFLAAGRYDFHEADISYIDRVDIGGNGIGVGTPESFEVILSRAMVASSDRNSDGVFGDVTVLGYDRNDLSSFPAPTGANVLVDGAALAADQRLIVLGQHGSGFYGGSGIGGLAGDDTLIGGAGSDVLAGGRGSNTLTGNAGQDFFSFYDLKPGNVDTVTDFSVVEQDRIVLGSNAFSALQTTGETVSGPYRSLVVADFGTLLLYDEVEGALLYDADGAGGDAAVVIAIVGSGLALTSESFIVHHEPVT